MPKAKKFPTTIYVTREGEGDDAYLNAFENGVEGIDEHGKVMAVYELVKTGRVSITKKFE